MTGRIIKIISNLYTIEANNKLYECHARGKFRNDSITPLVGDYCTFDEKNNYILEIHERKNHLLRPPISNVDIALIITSCKSPDLSLNLLDKLICNITLNNITPVICLTKTDLLTKEEKKEIKTIFKYYKSIGIPVFTNKNTFSLKRFLKNKVIVLTGQTGAGKSTLLNKLNKNLNLQTAEISTFLGRGKHTTRHTEIFKVGKILIADTPGFSSLDLTNITKEELKDCFPEFKKYPCPFKDCSHQSEKDCHVKKALEECLILKSRYDNYVKFLKEVK